MASRVTLVQAPRCGACQKPCRRVGFAFTCDTCGEVQLLEEVLAGFGIRLEEAALPGRLRRRSARDREQPAI
jgi:hypothetical protein